LKIVMPPYLSRKSSKFGMQMQILTQPRKHDKHKSEIYTKKSKYTSLNYEV